MEPFIDLGGFSRQATGDAGAGEWEPEFVPAGLEVQAGDVPGIFLLVAGAGTRNLDRAPGVDFQGGRIGKI